MLAPSAMRLANMPLLRLSTPEVFVVMSMRLWFASQATPDAGVSDWREGFERAQLPMSAAACFDMLMRVVGTRRQEPLDIRWQCCSRLGQDEATFLDCLTLLQRGSACEAYALIGGWLCPCAHSAVFGLSEQFAQSLSDVFGVLKNGSHLSPQEHRDLDSPRRDFVLH